MSAGWWTTSGAFWPDPLTARGSSCWSTSIPRFPRRWWATHVRVQQVLLNFGSNAVKFTAEGEVVIRLAVLRRECRRAVALRFEVIDTGIGIAEADSSGCSAPSPRPTRRPHASSGGPASD